MICCLTAIKSLWGFPAERIRCVLHCLLYTSSIPDAVALAIKSPAGTVRQTGDFKIDTTPIDGGGIDIARLSQLGTEGVLALLADSTNAAKPGLTESERKVGETFETQFRKANGRR